MAFLLGATAPACNDPAPISAPIDDGTDAAEDVGALDATVDEAPETLSDLANEITAPDAGPTVPPDFQDPWCASVRGGAGTVDDSTPHVSFSQAHATYRFFAPHGGYEAADLLLRDSLAQSMLDLGDAARAYAKAGISACFQRTHAVTPDATASVEVTDGVATIRPGSGDINVPETATAIVIDLRDLQASDATLTALTSIARQVLPSPLSATQREFITHQGLTDEVYVAFSGYSHSKTRSFLPELPGEAAIERPIALLLSDNLAPAVATFAGRLRLSGAATLIGADLHAGVAESTWMPLSPTEGLAIRTSSLITNGVMWPDVILADSPELWAPDQWPQTPAAVEGPTQRPVHVLLPVFQHGTGEPSLSLATTLAGLMVFHGGLRRFFPYFDTVGDTIDETLESLAQQIWDIAEVDGHAADLEVWQVGRALGRLSHELHDGHGFVGFPQSGDVPADYTRLPLVLDHVDSGLPVVTRSLAEQLPAGSVIHAINGQDMLEFYADMRLRLSSATEGYARVRIKQSLLYSVDSPVIATTLPSGETVDVTVEPMSNAEILEQMPREPWLRVDSGWLDEYGASDLYFVNLSPSDPGEEAEILGHIQTALDSAAGLVLDLRGYPAIPSWLDAATTLFGGRRSSIYRTPRWTGPDALDSVEQQNNFGGAIGASPIPLVLLVGPGTVSRGEDLGTGLIDAAPDMTVVGRQTAGTNGSITGIMLPGGFSVTFTGMEVHNPDGSLFHGVGILPDIVVPVSVEDLAAGVDSDVQTAVDVLKP